jgi:predicted MPP superfamily phosphohydrolase
MTLMNTYRNKRFLITFIWLISGLLLIHTGTLNAQEPDLIFGVIADCQYCDIEANGERKYAQSDEKLEQAVTHLNRMDLDFVVHLGDFIDRDYQSFQVVLPIWEQLTMPAYHVLGNHDYSVDNQYKSRIHTLLGMPAKYYDFGYKKWRFVVLDGNDLSMHAYPGGTKKYRQSRESYEKHAANSPEWNGALGKTQLQWLESALKKAQDAGESVILFAHFPVYPENRHNLWNAPEIVELIGQYPGVKMYMNGHNHAGNYGEKNGVHYLTLKGMVNTDTTSYAVVGLSETQVKISGCGREVSRKLSLSK